MASDECHAQWNGRGTVPNVHWRGAAAIRQPANGPSRTAWRIGTLTTNLIYLNPFSILVFPVGDFPILLHLPGLTSVASVYLKPLAFIEPGFCHVIPRTFLDGLFHF